ncbi:MAG: glutamate--cysteine ligase [Rhodomicrobium sp.]
MMLASGETQAPVIESRDELVAYIGEGAKPKAEWRIGSEHEKFPFYRDGLRPVPYEGPAGIQALLEGMAARFGWRPVYDNEYIIALEEPSSELGGSITLEPGGQFELSGAPVQTIFQTCAEVDKHLEHVHEIAGPLGIAFLGLGFSPLWTLGETPRMPKSRYGIMTAYMPKVGRLGLDMMYRSATVQVNLDFSDEADMVKKLRVSLALQPIAAALFANSPFTEGKPNGYLSFRSAIWLDTDPARTGMLPFAFEDGMSYERYVDYALDVPMYFVRRNKKYINAAGGSFRDFLDGRLAQLPGEKPTLSDWADHLTTLFPEVRLKRYLEMRGADSGSWRSLCALPAFWTGLLYHQPSLDAAYDLIKDWTAEERQQLRNDVPRLALKTPFRRGTVLDVARRAVDLASGGLKARGHTDLVSGDESIFIAPLAEIVERGQTEAERLLERYRGEWGGDVRPVFTESAY